MNNTPHSIGLFTTDQDLIVRSWDEWLAMRSGISVEQACGKPLAEVLPELQSRGLLNRFKGVLAEGTVEVLAPAFHHYLVPCSPHPPSARFDRMQQRVTLAPLRTEEGTVGVLVTIEDVTGRLERERELGEQLSSADEQTRLRAAEALAAEETLAPVHPLMEALGDPSWRVRRVAVQEIARSGGTPAVAALLRSLRHEYHNLSVLNSALQVLAMMNLDTVSPLIGFLSDPDTQLRIYAALALGETGNIQAVPELITAMNDADPNVGFHAIEALGKLRAQEAVIPLCAVAETGDFFPAFAAVEALRRIGNQAAAPRILNLLGNDLLRDAAVEAIGQLGGEEAVAPLAGLLSAPESPFRLVARALASLFDRYEKRYGEGAHISDLGRRFITAAGAWNLMEMLKDPGVQGDPLDLRAIALVLGWLEGSAVERALTRLLGHPTARREVVEALVRHGHRVTDLLIEQIGAEDLDTRKAAVIALGRIGDVKSVAALIGALERDAELIVIAAGALAKIGDRSAFEALVAFLGHPDAAVRQAVIAALNSLGHPDMPRTMVGLLKDSDPRVRESAVKISGYFGYPACLDLLFERCLDPSEAVRCAAVEHVAYLDENRVVPALAGALSDPNPRVRAAAARALSHVEMPLALAPLLTGLRDEDSWVRYFSARSLGKFERLASGPPPSRNGAASISCPEGTTPDEIFNTLVRITLKDTAIQVRIAAMEALGRTGGPRAVPVLSPLIDESNPDIARAAMGALGLIDHPDALQPLLTALHTADPMKRQNAIRAFGERGGPDAAGALRWVATTDRDDAVVEAAVEALAHMGSPEAVTALLTIAEDPRRRESCVSALASLGEAKADWIARGFGHADPAVRVATVQALARMKQPRATQRLLAALDDREAPVRLEAVSALNLLGSRQGEAKLAELAGTDPDTGVRNAARKILG